MPKKTNSLKILLGLFIVLLFITSLVSFTHAQTNDNQSTTVRLVVHILDIDQSQKLVELKIFVFIDDFPYNESQVGVWIVGAGSTIVQCNNTSPKTIDTWYAQGESEPTTWLLEGRGENFPFDSYNLRFVVHGMDFVDQNFTLKSEGHQAFFTGSKAYSLNDLWNVDNGLIPIGYVKVKEIGFSIRRSSNSLIISILQFLIPIIGCYYLLGATLMLDPKKQLAERLRVYLSLFVFAPSFLIVIQTFLPYRSSLSFPEFLLVNLIVSNTVFGIFSTFGNFKKSPKAKILHSKWDNWASIISLMIFLTIYLYTLVGRIDLLSSLIFTYIIIPSYIYSNFAMMSKAQFMKEIRMVTVFIILALIPLILLLFLALLPR